MLLSTLLDHINYHRETNHQSELTTLSEALSDYIEAFGDRPALAHETQALLVALR